MCAPRRLHLKPMLHNEVVCQVGTLLTLLDSVLAKSAAAAAGDAGAAAGMERVFLFSLAWSLGGLLDSRDRAAFDAELRTQSSALPKRARGFAASALLPVSVHLVYVNPPTAADALAWQRLLQYLPFEILALTINMP